MAWGRPVSQPSPSGERLAWGRCHHGRRSLSGGFAQPPHDAVPYGGGRQPHGGLVSPAARSSTPCILSTSAPVSSIHGARRFTSQRKACASRWTLSVSLPASVTT